MPFLFISVHFGIGATIRTSRDIQCLPWSGFYGLCAAAKQGLSTKCNILAAFILLSCQVSLNRCRAVAGCSRNWQGDMTIMEEQGVWADTEKCWNIRQLTENIPHLVYYTRLTIGFISGCARPPQSQSGAIFCHLNDHCVVFESASRFKTTFPGRYEMVNGPGWSLVQAVLLF